MRLNIAWTVLTALLLSLCLLQRETVDSLLSTNARLIGQVVALQAHPVHDAHLTVFKERGGSMLIVVNGRFQHRVHSVCGDTRSL